MSPAEVDRHYAPEFSIAGDISDSLIRLTTALESADHQRAADWAEALRDDMPEDESALTTSDHSPIKPQRSLHDLRRVMAADDPLISYVGAHKVWIARQ